MHARVLGRMELGVSGTVVQMPPGPVTELLRGLLLRPNVVHDHETLIAWLWPEDAPSDPEVARERLFVVVSRLRRRLAGGGAGGLAVVTESGGYRLDAGAEALDRVAFELLADAALGGDQAALDRALALWRGTPYADYPASPERRRQRRHLTALRDRLLAIRPGPSPSWSVQGAFDRTRYLRPAVGHRGLLRRARLIDRLAIGTGSPLRVVVAPAGFGKSVLLAQWAEVHPGPVAWLAVEPTDRDPVRFWTSVRASLEVAGLTMDAGVARRADPGSALDLAALAESVRAASEPVVLVVDDVHRMEAHDAIAELVRFAEEVGLGLSVALGSRTPIAQRGVDVDTVGTAALRLGAEDLLCTGEEVVEIVRGRAAQVDAAALVARTEGWPLAVDHFARSGVGALERRVRDSGLYDYIVEEVKGSLPEELRRFLLHTAHLERLSTDLCVAVAPDLDADRILDLLHRHGSLLVDAEGQTEGWYRYRHLVREVLRTRADADPSVDVTTGHRRAARWLAEQGMVEEALHHAIEGNDAVLVGELAGGVLWDLVLRSKFHTGRRLLSRLDPELLLDHRATHDLATIAAASWLGPRGCEAWMTSRRHRYRDDDDLLPLVLDAHRHYLEGNATAAIERSEAALALVGPYGERHPTRAGIAEVVGDMLVLNNLSARMLAGRVHPDDPELWALSGSRRAAAPVVSAWLLGEWAFLAYVRGDHARAAALVDQAAGRLASFDATSAHLGAGRLLVARALLRADAVDDPAVLQPIVDDLRAMVPLYRRLGRDVELIQVLLALHRVGHRLGRPEAIGLLDEADVLLSLCTDAPLLVEARRRFLPEAAGAARAPEGLTDRQGEVLALLATALDLSSIAEALGMSRHTVQDHLKAIYRTLGVRSRQGAVRQAHALGIRGPDRSPVGGR